MSNCYSLKNTRIQRRIAVLAFLRVRPRPLSLSGVLNPMKQDPSFVPTSWTVVSQAADPKNPDYAEAMRLLCNQYWYPLYAFCRRKFSKSPQEAEDLTQSFFGRLIERGIVSKASAEKGRFRTYLLTCFKRFVINDFKRAGVKYVSISQNDAEQRMRLEPASVELTPEESFDRDWAIQVLQLSLESLRDSYIRRNRQAWYDKLGKFLQARPVAGEYQCAAVELGVSVDAVKAEVTRMRKRYQESIRAQIAETVDEKSSIEEELGALFASLSK